MGETESSLGGEKLVSLKAGHFEVMVDVEAISSSSLTPISTLSQISVM
jgi:hypothetical protein